MTNFIFHSTYTALTFPRNHKGTQRERKMPEEIISEQTNRNDETSPSDAALTQTVSTPIQNAFENIKTVAIKLRFYVFQYSL